MSRHTQKSKESQPSKNTRKEPLASAVQYLKTLCLTTPEGNKPNRRDISTLITTKGRGAFAFRFQPQNPPKVPSDNIIFSYHCGYTHEQLPVIHHQSVNDDLLLSIGKFLDKGATTSNRTNTYDYFAKWLQENVFKGESITYHAITQDELDALFIEQQAKETLLALLSPECEAHGPFDLEQDAEGYIIVKAIAPSTNQSKPDELVKSWYLQDLLIKDNGLEYDDTMSNAASLRTIPIAIDTITKAIEQQKAREASSCGAASAAAGTAVSASSATSSEAKAAEETSVAARQEIAIRALRELAVYSQSNCLETGLEDYRFLDIKEDRDTIGQFNYRAYTNHVPPDYDPLSELITEQNGFRPGGVLGNLERFQTREDAMGSIISALDNVQKIQNAHQTLSFIAMFPVPHPMSFSIKQGVDPTGTDFMVSFTCQSSNSRFPYLVERNQYLSELITTTNNFPANGIEANAYLFQTNKQAIATIHRAIAESLTNNTSAAVSASRTAGSSAHNSARLMASTKDRESAVARARATLDSMCSNPKVVMHERETKPYYLYFDRYSSADGSRQDYTFKAEEGLTQVDTTLSELFNCENITELLQEHPEYFVDKATADKHISTALEKRIQWLNSAENNYGIVGARS